MDHIVECVNTCARQEDNSWVIPHLSDEPPRVITSVIHPEGWQHHTLYPNTPVYGASFTECVYNGNEWVEKDKQAESIEKLVAPIQNQVMEHAKDVLSGVDSVEKITYANRKRIERNRLIKDLESEYLTVREKAVNKLTKDYPEATKGLLELWERERNPHLREYVEQVLEFRGAI